MVYIALRRKVLNIAMHLRPRHRRWVEDFVDAYDFRLAQYLDIKEEHNKLLIRLEREGILQRWAQEKNDIRPSASPQ